MVDSPCLRLFHRRTNEVAPFGPRAVVVLHVLVAEQILQDEPRVARPLADAAIGDYRLVAGHADRSVELLQLVDALEGAIIIGGLRPGHAFRAWNMTTALAGFGQSRRRQGLSREFSRASHR